MTFFFIWLFGCVIEWIAFLVAYGYAKARRLDGFAIDGEVAIFIMVWPLVAIGYVIAGVVYLPILVGRLLGRP